VEGEWVKSLAITMIFRDYRGREVRLPDERLAYILRKHPEIAGLEEAMRETLDLPEQVRQSTSDPVRVNLYYRWHIGTTRGDKYLCVVVKLVDDDAFVITAYLTEEIKRGDVIWPRGR